MAVTDAICTHAQESFSNVTDIENCECLCEKLWTFLPVPLPTTVNLTVEEKIEIIVNELSVDKKNTSSNHRKYVSVMDYRSTSMGIGIIASVILAVIIGIIVLIDISSVYGEIRPYLLLILHNIRSGNRFDHVEKNMNNLGRSNSQNTNKTSTLGWFSRENLLFKDTDTNI